MSDLDISKLLGNDESQPETPPQNTAGTHSNPHSNPALGSVAERLDRLKKEKEQSEHQMKINIFTREGFVLIGFDMPQMGLRLTKTQAKEFARRIMKECY